MLMNKFGIEVEFSGIERRRAAIVIAKALGTKAIHKGGPHDRYEIRQSDRIWSIVTDPSITPCRLIEEGKRVPANTFYQCELITPTLTYQSNDITILQELLKKLEAEGAICNETCAAHIHVSGIEFNVEHLRVLCNIIYSKQALLGRALKIEPKRKRYCRPLSEDFLVELNKKKPTNSMDFAEVWYGGPNSLTNLWDDPYHHSRYQIINLGNIFGDGPKTIEFRCFNGTLNDSIIKSYIQLSLLITAQALGDKASNKEPKPVNERHEFLIWLLQLGVISDEFRSMCSLLLKNLNSGCKDTLEEEEEEEEEENPVSVEIPNGKGNCPSQTSFEVEANEKRVERRLTQSPSIGWSPEVLEMLNQIANMDLSQFISPGLDSPDSLDPLSPADLQLIIEAVDDYPDWDTDFEPLGKEKRADTDS